MEKQNESVQPLLTDFGPIMMTYAYWKSGKLNDRAIFELFFHKNPFNGEFTIFAGLEECVKFLQRFRYSQSDIEYLKELLPTDTENDFFIFLSKITAEDIILYSVQEGTVVFPREPLMRIEGPLIIAQLLKTTFLNLINYASLMATNAAKYRMNAGNLGLLEMGLRRAQGPDGGLSASKYAYIGGFDTTSNVLAGKLFNIPVIGTQGHSYVSSFSGFSDLKDTKLKPAIGDVACDLFKLAVEWRNKLLVNEDVNDGELAAFVSFAIAFPDKFVTLIDTYDVIKSGLVNFCAVALALNDLGYQAIGVRIDSGDLAYLSSICRKYFIKVGEMHKISWFKDMHIIASNDINEDTLISLNEQVCKIDCFGIGTNLVTCQNQPAFTCIYKLIELNGQPRMKLSHDINKIMLPGRKEIYRLYGDDGYALLDLIQNSNEHSPEIGQKVLCRHPFMEAKRAYVTSHQIEKLYKLYWQNSKVCQPMPSVQEIRLRAAESMKSIRFDIKRKLNPAQYKVSVSDKMYNNFHQLWLKMVPIDELS